MQQTIPSANKFAAGLAPDPQRIKINRNSLKEKINLLATIHGDLILV